MGVTEVIRTEDRGFPAETASHGANVTTIADYDKGRLCAGPFVRDSGHYIV